jgi:hypothetical protein
VSDDAYCVRWRHGVALPLDLTDASAVCRCCDVDPKIHPWPSTTRAILLHAYNNQPPGFSLPSLTRLHRRSFIDRRKIWLVASCLLSGMTATMSRQWPFSQRLLLLSKLWWTMAVSHVLSVFGSMFRPSFVVATTTHSFILGRRRQERNCSIHKTINSEAFILW